MDTTVLISGAAVVGIFVAWAVGHFGTGRAAWSAVKTEAAALDTKAAGLRPALTSIEHATAQEAAAAAVRAIQWLTDKSHQQAIVSKAQAEMAAMDALLAHVQAQLQPKA